MVKPLEDALDDLKSVAKPGSLVQDLLLQDINLVRYNNIKIKLFKKGRHNNNNNNKIARSARGDENFNSNIGLVAPALEEKNNERNRAESHKLSGCIGEKDPEEKQEQLQPPLKKSSPASQQASVES